MPEVAQDAAALGVGKRCARGDIEGELHLAVGGVDALAARARRLGEPLRQVDGGDDHAAGDPRAGSDGQVLHAAHTTSELKIAIDFAAVAYRKHLDCDRAVVDESEDPVRADAVAPLPGPVRSEPFPQRSRVGAAVQVVFDPGGDESSVEAVHFLQLLACARRELDFVAAGR